MRKSTLALLCSAAAFMSTGLVSSNVMAAGLSLDGRQKPLREADTLPRAGTQSSTKLLSKSSDIAGLTNEQVGDPASFGMHAVWLGVAQTQSVLLRDDCTGTDPTYERCIKLNPQPASTTFDEKKLASLYIPAGSSLSLLCQWVTPFWNYQFHNLTGVNQPNARITLTPYITIYNDVLNDPAAIDPSTGLPYGGEFTYSISMTHAESRSLMAGERQMQRLNYSRVCIGGIVSAQNLIDMFGLPQYLADQFLQKDTTILFHLRGSAALVDDASLMYGVRIMGDQKP
ncbi:hypothetical protein HPT27_05920 [Permianibacter sp. IMCC34836]|uniref:hypothetical protein n=1 Tax=Permianibacter fluminis TaxID=2738515 RepID=UPI001552EBE2|nr:hypothetical protein [Permianibacter fluminis]NQD36554.1 hypothetical protein [Permianibacter fluminis]